MILNGPTLLTIFVTDLRPVFSVLFRSGPSSLTCACPFVEIPARSDQSCDVKCQNLILCHKMLKYHSGVKGHMQ